jgi:tRNA threonylcarbamoyladenosine biosynthesis protein TsaE
MSIFKKISPLSDIKNITKYLNDIFLRDKLDYKKDSIIVFLKGNLASGKTTFVKNFAKMYNIKNVSSPTFCILNNYNNKIYHYDLYTCGIDKFISLGLLNELNNNGIHFIEWGDDIFKQNLSKYGFKYYELKINFIPIKEGSKIQEREYIFD